MKRFACALLLAFSFASPASATTLTPGNLLLSYQNKIGEYTPGGDLVQEIAVPSPLAPINNSVLALDVVVDQQKRMHVLSGPNIFTLYLSTYDLEAETWSFHSIAGWGLANVTYYGGIGISDNYIFGADQATGGGEQAGLIRVSLSDLSDVQRFNLPAGHMATVGLDGMLYTLSYSGSNGLRQIDPDTMQVVKNFNINGYGVAVDANGDIYKTGGGLYHYDSDGNLLESFQAPYATSVEVGPDGTLVATNGGVVTVANTSDLSSQFYFDTMQPYFGYNGFTTIVPEFLSDPFPGDTDGDGDLDTADITKALQNFTGSGGTGKTAADGDTDMDGDVDTDDLTTAFQNFTGTWPDAAQLIYDPATGNVQLDARGAPGHMITQFALQNAAGGLDFNTGVANLPFPNGSTFDIPTLLANADGAEDGFSGTWDLGNVFPTGLNDTTLASFLTAATYAGESGGGSSLPFDLLVTSSSAAIVPEPSTMFLSLVGLACIWSLQLARSKRKPVILESARCVA